MYTLPANISDFSYEQISDLENKRVVIRSCLNVSIDDYGEITDSTRFYESLPLILEIARGAKSTVILGHLGRPEAVEDPAQRDKKFSFKRIYEMLSEELKELDIEIEFIKDLSEENIKKMQNQGNSEAGKKVFLLENIRFFKGEESENQAECENFARILASLGDVFINDAFADYRESASTYRIAKFSPSYLGPVFMKEILKLSELDNPNRPFIAILGGAKLSEKLDALKALCEHADQILIGGAMAYTLMKAKGIETGRSRFEEDKLEVAKEINEKYDEKIVLPIDHKVIKTIEDLKNGTGDFSIVPGIEQNDNPSDYNIAVDIGPETLRLFEHKISNAQTILWNGPMGIFEWQDAEWGTKQLAKAIAGNTKAYKLIGGGDTITAVNNFELSGFDHISTGGGAMLAFIAYEKFPTLDVILGSRS